MKYTKQEIQEAADRLNQLVKPGDTVYTKLSHVSQSGMLRVIDCYIIKDNEPINISWYVARVCDYPLDKNHDGLRVGGCGMDMGFSVVYNLSRSLYRDGFDCIGDHCPSNDHFNRENNTHHKDGGYALKHRWL